MTRSNRYRAARTRRHAYRPRPDALEGRCLLSSFTVINGDDAGPGSLREVIALADANPGADTIDFQAGLGAITLTSGQLTLSGDVTIAGPAGGVTIGRSEAAGTPEFR